MIYGNGFAGKEGTTKGFAGGRGKAHQMWHDGKLFCMLFWDELWGRFVPDSQNQISMAWKISFLIL